MFSLTQRSMPEAKLPKAAWHSCVRPTAVLEGLQAGRLPSYESYRRTNVVAVASSLGTNDCAGILPAERPFQHPEALP